MSKEEIPTPRRALGDVTNKIVGKRGFSLVSDDTSFHCAKKDCVVLDNNFGTGESVLRPHSCNEINSLKGKATCVGVKDGEVVRESDADGEKTESVSKRKVESSLGDVSVESSKDEYVDVSRFPESQESICGLDICIGQKGADGFSSMSVDLIKSCSCSFCTKAAYLWSNLHYQDMKGRIAAVNKSQKEVSILVHQKSKDLAGVRYGQGNYSNLESDLTGRWKSLFLHMEDIFVRESIQLETKLSTLRELRDDCKADLEK